MFKRNLGSYTFNQCTCFDDKNYGHLFVWCFSQIQATNGKLLALKVTVPRH